jgi:hypothetical protein
MARQKFRASVLASYGANASQIEELLAYNHNTFDHKNLILPFDFKFVPEPHVAVWQEYAQAAKSIGTFEILKQVLVQFQFPILEGISQTNEYRAATRRGIPVDGITQATGLVLKKPEALNLIIYQSLAGAIPVLITENREDFVAIVQALTMHNEPKPVPASMGACIVSGFNNWDRIRKYRRQWEAQNPKNCSEVNWRIEFQRLLPQKQLYQDKFIIASGGYYSNVSHLDIGLEESQWRQMSLQIRLEHECTHYLTQRLFFSMRNNLLDEFIADYRGIVSACGHYRSDWFLRFMGLESFPNYREGGRLENYRGQPPLSDGSFKILQALVKNASQNLQQFEIKHKDKLITVNDQKLMLIALSFLTLEELASEQACLYIEKAIDNLCIKCDIFC